jgi:hypothetical protein
MLMARNLQMLEYGEEYGAEYGAMANEHLLMSDPKTDAAKHADLERAEAAEALWTLPPGSFVVPCVVLRVTHTHTHAHMHTCTHTHTLLMGWGHAG